MIVCTGCDISGRAKCAVEKHCSKCYEEVACPGNPEDEGFSCPEGQESYEKTICNSNECEEYFSEWQHCDTCSTLLFGRNIYHNCDTCPDIIDNAPENCHLVCDWKGGNNDILTSREPIDEEYYCDNCGYNDTSSNPYYLHGCAE